MLIVWDPVGSIAVLLAFCAAAAVVGGLAGRLFVEITRGNRH